MRNCSLSKSRTSLAVAKTRGPDATTGDVVRALKAIRRFWSQKPPGKRAKNWRYVDPSGQLIPGADGCPGDSCWPQAWRFPGWYPRPKRKAKSDFVFMRKGREWIPLDDPNAPEVRGDDGSLMSDAVGNTAEFAKGKGERPIRLAIGACSRFRPSV